MGAEYFGDPTINADLEIQKLLIESLKVLDIKDIVLDINHLDVFNSLKNKIDLSPNESSKLGNAMMLKDKAEIENILSKKNETEIINKLVLFQIFMVMNLYLKSLKISYLIRVLQMRLLSR